MGRVNYISNIVTSVLNKVYYKRSFQALYNQIDRIDGIKDIIQSESRGKDNYEKFVFALKDNTVLIQQIKALLNNDPLMSYKIDYYTNLLSNASQIIANNERHSNRLRWQIMRIYRNRCMIVHDGSSMPYLEFITENIHYYIDEVFEHIIDCIEKGMISNDSMLGFARTSEVKKNKLLEAVKKDKRSLSNEEFKQLFLDA